MTVVALVVAVAYLLGTFPTARVVGGALGHDVEREGSGNPGASNVYRLAGKRAGAAVFMGDALKGVVASAIGFAAGDRNLALASGAAAVLGHCFPVTRRFRGGKGVATAAGFALVIEPVLAIGALAVWAAVARITRRASVASLVIAAAWPVGVVAWRGLGAEAAVVAGVAVLIVLRHAGNLTRLMRGDERELP
jgi:glycerol-3-phosphate acyltransferase PlsY